MADKLRFKKLAHTALETNRIEQNFLKFNNVPALSQQSSKYIPDSESLYKKIKELQCSIKKLELKLRLVDKEYIDDSKNNSKNEFNKLIGEIKYSCDNFQKDETNKFIKEMKEKNADNKNKAHDNEHKEVIDILNFYLPCLSVFASLAVASLATTEITQENITQATNTFDAFMVGFIITIKPYIENSAAGIDLYSKAWDLYSENINKTYKKISITAGVVEASISSNIKAHIPQIIINATKNINTNIKLILDKKGKKITKKLLLTYTMFSITTFLIILFMEKTIGFGNTEAFFDKNITMVFNKVSRITNADAYGGKKAKKSRKQKKSINRK